MNTSSLTALACDRVHLLRFLRQRGSGSSRDVQREFPDVGAGNTAVALRVLEEQRWIQITESAPQLRWVFDAHTASECLGRVLLALPGAVAARERDDDRIAREVKLLESRTKLRILAALRADPSLSHDQLAARLGRHKSSIATHRLDLEASGWIVDGRPVDRPELQVLRLLLELGGVW